MKSMIYIIKTEEKKCINKWKCSTAVGVSEYWYGVPTYRHQ